MNFSNDKTIILSTVELLVFVETNVGNLTFKGVQNCIIIHTIKLLFVSTFVYYCQRHKRTLHHL